jgi:hypothetical protein
MVLPFKGNQAWMFHGIDKEFLDRCISKLGRYQAILENEPTNPLEYIFTTYEPEEALSYAITSSIDPNRQGVVLLIPRIAQVKTRFDYDGWKRGEGDMPFLLPNEFEIFDIESPHQLLNDSVRPRYLEFAVAETKRENMGGLYKLLSNYSSEQETKIRERAMQLNSELPILEKQKTTIDHLLERELLDKDYFR